MGPKNSENLEKLGEVSISKRLSTDIIKPEAKKAISEKHKFEFRCKCGYTSSGTSGVHWMKVHLVKKHNLQPEDIKFRASDGDSIQLVHTENSKLTDKCTHSTKINTTNSKLRDNAYDAAIDSTLQKFKIPGYLP